MDFLDPKKKRAHRIRLYVGYFLMAVALSIGTLILLYEAFGYDVNRKTGEVIQNGLVFLETHPEPASITVNGKPEGQTGTRLILPAGRYDIQLKRDGYRPWTRSFELEGSAIERLVYPFLFPEKLEPRDVQAYPAAPTFATQSLDRKTLLVQPTASLTRLDVIDMTGETSPATPLALPDTLFTAAPGEHRLSLVEWSADNRHVLLKHTFGTAFEFVMVDRDEPAQSFSVNKLFNVPITEAALVDKKFDRLHLLDANGGILRFADTRARTVALVANRVRSFKSYGDNVLLYVTEEGAPADKALVNVRRSDTIYKIRDLPRSALYLTDLTKYDDRWYMAVASGSEKKAYIYEDVFEIVDQPQPRLPAPTAVLRVQQPEFLSISANSRFVGMQGGSEFAVYDAEHDRSYRYDTRLPLAAGQKATWMDGHRYAVVSENQMFVFEYDGINMQKLVGALPDFPPFFNRDYDNLYIMGPSVAAKDKPALTRMSMRIPADQ